MIINIVLCDDDPKELAHLERLVRSHLDSTGKYEYVIKTYNSGSQLDFDLEDEGKAHLYILDIDMPETNGIALAKRIRELHTNAILYFYTSHTEYATEGYLVEARRFLIKGGNDDYLREALDYACAQQIKLHDECVSVSWIRDVYNIPIADIIYVTREKRQTIIYTQDHGVFRSLMGIHDLYKKIGRPFFVFIDKGTFINLDFVHRTDQDTITLFGGYQLPISRKRISNVKDMIAKYYHVN